MYKKHRSHSLLRRRTLLYTIFEGQELLRTESLVVDLSSCFNKVLQVSAGEEVAEADKLAVVGILDVHNSPTVPAATDRLAIDDNTVL